MEEFWSAKDGQCCVLSDHVTREVYRCSSNVTAFVNSATRQAGLGSDKLAAVCLIMDDFTNNVTTLYKLSDDVAVHEQLYLFQGRRSYIHYISKKLVTYG